MKKIEEIIQNTTEETQEKLKTYQKEVDIPFYSQKIQNLLAQLQRRL